MTKPAIGFAGAALYVAAVLVLGWWLGAQSALGRSDAALAVPTAMVPSLLYVHRSRAQRGRLAAPLILLAVTLLVGGLVTPRQTLAGWIDPAQALALVGGCTMALLAAVGWRRLTGQSRPAVRWIAAMAVAIGWWFAAHIMLAVGYAPGRLILPDNGRLVVVSGLPLTATAADFGALASGSATDAAAWTALRHMVPSSQMVDDLAKGALGRSDRLVLIHPRALPPSALVEIDRFIRRGGRAVIFADALSSWPPPFALGDPRNPPVTSLLTPLLDHMGIRLDMPVLGENQPTARTDHDHRLILHSAGRFGRAPRGCVSGGVGADGAPTILHCAIERGHVALVADADLLFAPLWQPRPGWALHLQPADPLGWTVDQLAIAPQSAPWRLRAHWRTID